MFQSVPSILVGVGLIVVVGFIISAIQESKAKKKDKASRDSSSKQLKTLVDPDVKVPLKLKEKIEINHDTRCFRFELPSEEHVLGKHFFFFFFFYKIICNNSIDVYPLHKLGQGYLLGLQDIGEFFKNILYTMVTNIDHYDKFLILYTQHNNS